MMSNVYFIYFVGFLIKKEFKVALSEIKVPESTLELVKKHVLVPFNSTSTPKGILLFENLVPLILICLLFKINKLLWKISGFSQRMRWTLFLFTRYLINEKALKHPWNVYPEKEMAAPMDIMPLKATHL